MLVKCCSIWTRCSRDVNHVRNVVLWCWWLFINNIVAIITYVLDGDINKVTKRCRSSRDIGEA